jgi:hypothetical protein
MLADFVKAWMADGGGDHWLGRLGSNDRLFHQEWNLWIAAYAWTVLNKRRS